MKKLVFLIIIIMSSNSIIYPQTKHYYLKLGKNTSQFRNDRTSRGDGIVVGAGLSYSTNNLSFINGFANLEVLYSYKQAVVENKIWPASSIMESDYKIGNINFSIGYLELPIKIGYYTAIGKRATLKVFTGLSASIPIVNKTSTTVKDIVFYWPEKKKLKVDYKRIELDHPENQLFNIIENISKTSLSFNLGTVLSYSFVNIELRYAYAIFETKDFIDLSIHDKVDTFYMLLGIEF